MEQNTQTIPMNPLGTSSFSYFNPSMGVPINTAVKAPTWMPGLDLILDVFDRHKDEIVEGWWAGPDNPLRHTKWVPMSPVVGLNAPAEELSLIRRAIEKARGGDTGMQSWQALHRIAERYLGRGEDAQPAAPAETPQSQGPTFSDQEMPSS